MKRQPNHARPPAARKIDFARAARAVRRMFAWKDVEVLEGWRLAVGYALIGGAVIGVIVFGADALVPGPAGPRSTAEHLAALAFCALSATAGWLLLNRPALAFWPSVATLIPQALWIYTPWASYRVTAGLALLPSWTTGRGFDVIIGGTATFRLAVVEPGIGYGIGVNFWALVALAALMMSEAARRKARPARAGVR